ncbi:MAG: metallophosphoesterase [Paludibacteraceae bacterium]|nr:metallophosphoesterase [Paludibacteraceae bacterium]
MKTTLFIILLISLVGIVYCSWRIWHLLPAPATVRWGAVVLFVLWFASLFLVFGRLDRLPMNLAACLYEVGTSFVFVFLYLTLLFLLLDLGRLLGMIPPSFLSHSLIGTLTVTTLLAVVFAYGNWNYYQKRRVELHLTTTKNLTRPLKLLMCSDLHFGYHNRRSSAESWVRMVNDENPDLVLITGDLIDNSLRPLREDGIAEVLRKVKAPVYACLGNHEYISDVRKAVAFYDEADITLLRDSSVRVGDITVIGRDDRTNGQRMLISQLAHVDSSYKVLLDHQPYQLDDAARNNIDLQLSGHTHYGQVWPISWITAAIYENAWGYLRKGKTDVYVSSGYGIWGGKFRIGSQSEYVVISLRNK